MTEQNKQKNCGTATRGPRAEERLAQFDEAVSKIKAVQGVAAISRMLRLSRLAVYSWIRATSTPTERRQREIIEAVDQWCAAVRQVDVAREQREAAEHAYKEAKAARRALERGCK